MLSLNQKNALSNIIPGFIHILVGSLFLLASVKSSRLIVSIALLLVIASQGFSLLRRTEKGDEMSSQSEYKAGYWANIILLLLLVLILLTLLVLSLRQKDITFSLEDAIGYLYILTGIDMLVRGISFHRFDKDGGTF